MKQCHHSFKPRYDLIYSTPFLDMEKFLLSGKVTKAKSGSNEPYLKEKRYVCDVCRKCGQQVNRKAIK